LRDLCKPNLISWLLVVGELGGANGQPSVGADLENGSFVFDVNLKKLILQTLFTWTTMSDCTFSGFLDLYSSFSMD
jgi:hypothetical protein